MKKLNASGYNLVELAIAVLILAAMASTVMMARSYMAKTTQKNSDKAFATQKAVQMVEELREGGLVNGSESGVTILDNFSDGLQVQRYPHDGQVRHKPSRSLERQHRPGPGLEILAAGGSGHRGQRSLRPYRDGYSLSRRHAPI